MRVAVLCLGATALQKFDAATGGMQLLLPPEQLLKQAAVEGVETQLEALPARSGAELSWTTLVAVRAAVVRAVETNEACVLLCGTDTLEEAAFALDLMCRFVLRRAGRPLVLTGAMLPADQAGTDNVKNLRDALLVGYVLSATRVLRCKDVTCKVWAPTSFDRRASPALRPFLPPTHAPARWPATLRQPTPWAAPCWW